MKSLSRLLNIGDSETKKGNSNYMIVEVKAFDNEPEIIINPKENFDEKLYYYSNAYNEDLTLKANENIRIINYQFVEKIEDYFTNKDKEKSFGELVREHTPDGKYGGGSLGFFCF